MRFSHLDISGFRNITRTAVELGPGLNYFHGANGAGKTALLEAVHLLCRGRSFRTQRSVGLIQHDAAMLRVSASGEDEFRGPVTLSIQRSRNHRTELRVDGQAERQMSVVARMTPLQVMLPDIAELVLGAPAVRRRWLDWGTFHVKQDYLALLRDYLRVLKQRNVLLRDSAAAAVIAPWTERLLRLADRVSEERREYLKGLESHFHRALTILAPELDISISYSRGWGQDSTLEKLLGDHHAREVKYGSTQWGPHRADVRLMIGDAAAGAVLSRGQAKMLASALQISQAAMLAAVQQRSSVFLIDDAGAELDRAHNLRLFRLLGEVGGQILATTTQQPDSNDSIASLVAGEVAGRNPFGGIGHAENGPEDLAPEGEVSGLRNAERSEAMDVRVFHVEHGAVRGE